MKKLITGTAGKPDPLSQLKPVKGIFDVFPLQLKDNPDDHIQWIDKPQSYQVIGVRNKNGSWTLTDGSTKVEARGGEGGTGISLGPITP